MLAIDTGWPPPVLLVTVIMPKGMRCAFGLQHRPARSRSMLPLNGCTSAGCRPSAMTRSTRLDAQVFEVGARGVEVAVVGHELALPAHRGEQDLLGGAALVRRHEVLHAGDALHHRLQAVEAARAGVALVAFHDGAPLARRHGAGAGVGQPVDQHVLGAQLEDVELGRLQQALALGARGHPDRLDGLDAEGFDQRLGHGVSGGVGGMAGESYHRPGPRGVG